MKKSFGHFSADGREYVITDATMPPRAQINFLWNDNLITGMNQFGSGEGIFNDRTMLYNDLRGRVDAINDGLAMLRWGGSEDMRFSWQPAQDTRSPGMPTSQLRISWTARPSPSSGWIETGVLAGIWKQAEPSASTVAVPRIRFTSQPD